ncbi:MAG TPA: TIM barrel protein [Solirubrobacteraceae bacterium]|nr:TIM barrel protein [Solirubrobacteraceae bacterium]
MEHSADPPPAAEPTGIPVRAPATATAHHPGARRIGGAPISWGACEVPGWGEMPDPETVLDEMARLGLRGTELGPPGFLPHDPGALASRLRHRGLEFVGSFVPLVLHERDADSARRMARDTLALLSQAGGQVLVIAVVQDLQWSPPRDLDDAAWRRLAAHAAEIESLATERGITFALHPHVGTLIETAAQVERGLAETTVGWCLDTGHLVIGGTDPAQFAREHGDRVTHVHLKDVDGDIAAEVRAGRLSLLQATQRGLFRPLGRGVAKVAATLAALDEHGYDGWLVLEQDTAITADEPAVTNAPMLDTQESIAFLNTAQRTEEINQ